KRGFDRAQGLAVAAEIAEHGAAPVQAFRAVGGTPQRHLDRRERCEIVAGRRRDLTLQEPAFDRAGLELQRLVDHDVRLDEQRVVPGAEQLAHLIEQPLELGVVLLAHRSHSNTRIRGFKKRRAYVTQKVILPGFNREMPTTPETVAAPTGLRSSAGS